MSAAAPWQSASAGPHDEAVPALFAPPLVVPAEAEEPPLVTPVPLEPPVPAPGLVLPATLVEPPEVLEVPPPAGGEVEPLLLLLHAQNSVPSADAKTVMLIALFIGDAFRNETREFRKRRVRSIRELCTID